MSPPPHRPPQGQGFRENITYSSARAEFSASLTVKSAAPVLLNLALTILGIRWKAFDGTALGLLTAWNAALGNSLHAGLNAIWVSCRRKMEGAARVYVERIW